MISSSTIVRWWSFIVLVAAFACLMTTTMAKTGPTHNKIVVCYMSTWAVYRPDKGSYAIENFDANLCTHVVYAFAGLDIAADAIKSLDPWQDLKEEYGKAGFERITNLKKIYPHLKVSLAIGGWNEGSKNYSVLTADAGRRARFVKQVSGFIRKYNFDGLDLDWEYPTQRGGEPRDRDNFVLLTKELREDFDKYNLLLTSAIGAAKNVIDEAYDVPKLSKYLHYLHIMCYDYGGSWDKKVGANAPLDGEGVLTVKYTIEYLMKLGAPANKLVMGVPFYGRTFRTPYDGELGQPSDAVGFQGPYTRENGFLGYNEICPLLTNKTSGWSQIWSPETDQAIARSQEATGTTRVVTFDSSRSIANKMRFAMIKDLAGVMVWSVDTDDFLGECEPELDTFADFGITTGVNLVIPKRINSNYPLLRTINEGIVLALDEIDQENHLQAQDKENEIPHGQDEQSHRKDNNSSAQRIFAASHVILVSFILMLLKL